MDRGLGLGGLLGIFCQNRMALFVATGVGRGKY